MILKAYRLTAWYPTLIALVMGLAQTLSWAQAPSSSTPSQQEPTKHRLSLGGLSVEIETHLDRLTKHFGPRFDRSAMVSSIQVNGQELVGPWGLADEFGLHGLGVLGFDEAIEGEAFVKIGVGRLVKDQSKPYAFSHAYPIDQLFPVETVVNDHEVSVIQQTPKESPWAYRYEKTYRLRSDQRLEIHYALTNLAEQSIEVEHYNHHWFLDPNQPVGPSYGVVTHFDLPPRDTGLIYQPRSLVVPNKLEDGEAQYYASDLVGLSSMMSQFEWQLSAQTQVRFQSSKPITRFALYADLDGFCPEMFTRHTIEPQQTVRWSGTYHFTSD